MVTPRRQLIQALRECLPGRSALLLGLLLRLLLMPLFLGGEWTAALARRGAPAVARPGGGGGPATPLETLRDKVAGAASLVAGSRTAEVVAGEPAVTWQTASQGDWVPRATFLLKVPLLLADAIALVALLALPAVGALPLEARRRLAAAWVLNPVLILTVYVLGSTEVLAVAAFLTGLSLTGRGQGGATLAAVALVVAGALAPVTIVLTFFYAQVTFDSGRHKARLVLAAVAGAVLRLGLPLALGAASWKEIMAALSVAQSELGAAITINEHELVRLQDHLPLYPFLLAIAATALLLRAGGARNGAGERSGMLAVLFALTVRVALAPVTLESLVWIVPCGVVVARDDTRCRWLLALLTACAVLYSCQWGRATAGNLLAPILPYEAFRWPAPMELLGTFYDAGKLLDLVRTGLAACCAAIAWTSWRALGIGDKVDAHHA